MNNTYIVLCTNIVLCQPHKIKPHQDRWGYGGNEVKRRK
jgi:hypothetical protein